MSKTKNNVDVKSAEEAVRQILRFMGEDPKRDGLVDTPARVIRMYKEILGGYEIDPLQYLKRVFKETEGFDEMVVLRDIRFQSMCEHHMLPFVGKAHIAYLPDKKVVGISKLARVVDAYSRRLQIQERLTTQIAKAINEALQPKGVAVVLEAVHMCMTLRGVQKPGTSMQTSYNTGLFRSDARTRKEFLSLIATPNTFAI